MAVWRASGSAPEKKPKEPEFGFADLMKVLPGEGIEVAAACLARPTDRLNVKAAYTFFDGPTRSMLGGYDSLDCLSLRLAYTRSK